MTTPGGVAFGIWSLIHLLLFEFILYELFSSIKRIFAINPIGWCFPLLASIFIDVWMGLDRYYIIAFVLAYFIISAVSYIYHIIVKRKVSSPVWVEPPPRVWLTDDPQEKERMVYKLFGRHPHILTYYGEDDETGELILQHLPNGSLSSYLINHPDTPLWRRVEWAREIAKAIAYLHTQGVVWYNIHLGNVLVADDMHVVLSDFKHSLIRPSDDYNCQHLPPLQYACPRSYFGRTSRRQDIFGFGVLLFALLADRYPHCVTSGLMPSDDEIMNTYTLHDEEIFDTLPDPVFGSVVDSCFRLRYWSGSELVEELELVSLSLMGYVVSIGISLACVAIF
ncbi:hypothetical protein M422DRAFT_783450 [Sphaerobolus stellatus SS14]|uniref:Protein kinase domain-containing protein n=1 Tax=Sphaerobolus stellatus (strain SS14) TaxID=990650 RepID=A0A0C9UST7_SPHS4|nr:hypothetical protein M422DRAFT_783450 [Sphaerobolus stellatus SS14]